MYVLYAGYFMFTLTVGAIYSRAAIYVPGYDNYIVLILTPDYYGDATTTKITSNIENYIGVSADVIITQSQNCDK